MPKDRELTILDFGCGKSYLTFAIYYYLRECQGLDVRIIGLDLKEDVIRKCSELSRKYGYDKLTFLQGDIAGYEGCSRVDMVVTLPCLRYGHRLRPVQGGQVGRQRHPFRPLLSA